MRINAFVLLLVVLGGCYTADVLDPSETDSPVAWGCGDGVLGPDELCDDGDENSDTAADACRSDCTPAGCGDGVVDSDEACDDGDGWGGDGCTPICTVEEGVLEVEPNDTWDAAQPWKGGVVYGSLTQGDTDCFSLDLPACAAIEARLVGECPLPATISLHDPKGLVLASGSPRGDGCAVLDPAEAAGARFVEGGRWSVCLQGLLGASVPFYTLEIDPIDPEDAAYSIGEDDDPDGDGKPDKCDVDRDGDGVLNEVDNCPDIPNGPEAVSFGPSSSGFLRVWLAAGPYTGTTSTSWCRPSDDDLVASNDAAAVPRLGDPAGDQTWRVLYQHQDRIEFLDEFAYVDAPREVYTAVYLRSTSTRDLTLALGPDDGARVWLNGVVVLDIDGCQGTTADQFTAPVTLLSGWNRMLVKVRDQGGAWGNYVRFLDAGSPVTDIEVSLGPDGSWLSNQRDADSDGIGDVCDDTP
jgi:cysteine-rich repeat protein